MKALSIGIAAALLAISIVAPASAQSDRQPLTPCLINTAAVVICSNTQAGNGTAGAGVILGAVNNSLVAQTATVSCFSNASGAASGPIVASIPPLGAGVAFTFPAGGRAYQLGLVCLASAAPTAAAPGNGIEIYVYPGPR